MLVQKEIKAVYLGDTKVRPTGGGGGSGNLSDYVFSSQNESSELRSIDCCGIVVSLDGMSLAAESSRIILNPSRTPFFRTITLGSKYDVTNLTWVGTVNGTNNSYQGGLYMKPDGTKLYNLSYYSGLYIRERAITGGDVTTASSSVTSSIKLSGPSAYSTSLFFKPDGTKLYIGDGTSNKLRQFPLSTAWDLSTIGSGTSITLSNVYGISFNKDGDNFYYVSGYNGSLYQLSLGTAWDITTINTTPINTLVLNNYGIRTSSYSTGLFFTEDYKYIFIGYDGGVVVLEYSG